MAGNNFNITGDNLPKDSGNRYLWALWDNQGNNFRLPFAYPTAPNGTAAAMAIGHMYHTITATMTSTGALSSAVDLGGYTQRSIYIDQMGSGCNVVWQISASGQGGWVTVTDRAAASYSATGSTNAGGYVLGMGAEMNALAPHTFVRLSATQNQTATRTFRWYLAT